MLQISSLQYRRFGSDTDVIVASGSPAASAALRSERSEALNSIEPPPPAERPRDRPTNEEGAGGGRRGAASEPPLELCAAASPEARPAPGLSGAHHSDSDGPTGACPACLCPALPASATPGRNTAVAQGDGGEEGGGGPGHAGVAGTDGAALPSAEQAAAAAVASGACAGAAGRGGSLSARTQRSGDPPTGAPAELPTPPAPTAAIEEDQEEEEAAGWVGRVCFVCQDTAADAVLVECGHGGLCAGVCRAGYRRMGKRTGKLTGVRSVGKRERVPEGERCGEQKCERSNVSGSTANQRICEKNKAADISAAS